MTVFYVNEEDKSSAQLVSNLNNLNIEPENITSGAKIEAGSEVTLYAHSSSYLDSEDERLVAEKKPEKLAELFARKIENKKDVTDIYLVSCEAGLATGKQPHQEIYAQLFADELVKQHFRPDIRVHAVSAPIDATAMRVSVVTHPSQRQVERGIVGGQVEAYYYGNEYSELLDEAIVLARQYDQHQRLVGETGLVAELEAAEKDGNYQRKTFLSTHRYKQSLNEPEHIYQAGKPLPQKLTKEALVRKCQIDDALRRLYLKAREFDKLSVLEPLTTYLDQLKKWPEARSDGQRALEAALIDNIVKFMMTESQLTHKKAEKHCRDYVEALQADLALIRNEENARLSFEMLKQHLIQAHKKRWGTSEYDKRVKSLQVETLPPRPLNETDIHKKTRIGELKQLIQYWRKEGETLKQAKRARHEQGVERAQRWTKPKSEWTREERQRSPLPDSLYKRVPKATLIDDIVGYREQRQSEFNYHIILGVLTAGIYYGLHCWLFPSKTKENKLTASEKLQAYVEKGNPPVFSEGEKSALRDGRLNELLNNHRTDEKIQEVLSIINTPHPSILSCFQ